MKFGLKGELGGYELEILLQRQRQRLEASVALELGHIEVQ